jgi:hypothetical protein
MQIQGLVPTLHRSKSTKPEEGSTTAVLEGDGRSREQEKSRVRAKHYIYFHAAGYCIRGLQLGTRIELHHYVSSKCRQRFMIAI